MIGNGPSLSAVDVSSLSTVATIATNRSFVAWREWRFTPTWYACTDALTAEALSDDLHEVVGFRDLRTFFVNVILRGRLPDDPRIVYVSNGGDRFGLHAEAVDGVHTARDYGNVGANSLQYLMALGIRRILLLGVDARYRPASGEGDPNHFRADYLPDRPYRRSAPHTDGWPAALDGARRAGLDVRLLSPGSSLPEIAGIPQDHRSLEQNLRWLADGEFVS